MLQASLARMESRIAFPFATGDLRCEVPVSPRAALLFPHPEARTLGSLSADERPDQLVVLDGTWTCARALYRENAWLQRLPHVALQPTRPGRYRVRREPRPQYLSTLEAVVESLRVLEPELRGLDELVAAFERMQDDHLLARSRSTAPRTRRVRQRERRAVPEVLRSLSPRVWVVYVEPTLRDEQGVRHCRQVALVRPADGTVLEWMASEGRPSTPGHLEQMELSEADLAGGLAGRALRERVLEALPEDAVLVSWNGTPPALLRAHLGIERESLVLKHIYCSVRQAGAPGVEDTLRREGVEAWQVGVRGRASRRLGATLALLDLLRRESAECGTCPTTPASPTESAPSAKPPAE